MAFSLQLPCLVYAAALCMCSARCGLAQDQQWNGTWKLNEAQSSLTGTVQHWDVEANGWWNINGVPGLKCASG